MREIVSRSLAQISSRLSFHDFRMVKGTGHTNLIFDIAMPNDMNGQEQAIKTALQNSLAEVHQGTVYLVITFEPESFSQTVSG